MRNARGNLAEMIDSIEIRDSIMPVYSNVSANPITLADDIRSAMLNQLESPVLWSQIITNMSQN
jgi:[acyl-carrier-protein] S-malonyltransferase